MIVCALAVAAPARALEVPQQPLGRVSDYAHALSAGERNKLDAQIQSYETGSTQIAVAIWKSIENESVEDFSNRVLIQWGLGGKKTDDGVLLAVFLDEHKIRIENGYGVEDRLTDARSAQIIRDVIAPRFKQNDLFGGLSAGVEAIHTVLGGGEVKAARHAPDLPWGLLALIAVMVILLIAGKTMGGSGWGGGGWGGGGWWWTGGSGGGSSWGGGWGGGGGGWGGGGGFSGGGGSGGGGGATGSW